MAATDSDSGQTGSQSVTSTQLGSPQQGSPATGSAADMPGAANATNARTANGGVPGLSAQSSGQPYPGVVGPTGSTQRDATNPNRSAPTAGGGTDGGSGGGGGSSGGGSGR
ncbi:MAG: hypothetical protein WDN25_27815 [Acetobacteraceae bacterium]